MKLHFEDPFVHDSVAYQKDAIEAVCDLFRGQEINRSEFTVTSSVGAQLSVGFTEDALGVGNRLSLLDDEIRANLADVQLRHGLPPTGVLASGDFTIEMETGTGKTYVYLRTIFELNKRYGFTKFVIVVPSVAIKEGVYKTLEITEQHFRALYAGVPFDYFQYDSSKLGQVRNFATSPHIQIMVMTAGAIRAKDVVLLYKDSEKIGGERPVDLIKATRPVLIVDEPQSVDGGEGGRGREALEAMGPLCTLRYSATHADKYHMVYRLSAVDAYEQKLVKQIEVASATVDGAQNKPYVRVISVSNKKNSISAKVEVDVQSRTGVSRKELVVYDGDDLQQTTGRPLYANLTIGEITVKKGKESVELRYPGGESFLKPGESHGDVDKSAIQREMIRRTIREHLDKEMRLRPLGIKVLSLFFIDTVAKYRQYDDSGNAVKGEYARMFEEEYTRAAKLDEYSTLFAGADLSRAAAEVHDGYFSIDKKGGWTDTAENNQSNRDNAERAYNLIMKEKEKLLSFETPLKFIFSHSALREGWDNPNVFQICTLRDINTERERRQTIGRGLRLCVRQDGTRVRDSDVNRLTVVATERYEEFAENLQREIEEDTGIRFGVVEEHQFAAILVKGLDGSEVPLGYDASRALWTHLREVGYIDARGRAQEKLLVALKDGKLELPKEFESQLEQVGAILKRLTSRLIIRNADERRSIGVRRAVLDSPEFKALWDRIKHKTTYRVQFDNEQLIVRCTEALRDAPQILKARLQWRKAELAIGKGGVEAIAKAGSTTKTLQETDVELPDIITELQDRTQLTRRSIVKILTECGRLHDFKANPQAFIDIAAEAINRCKRRELVDGIKYQRLGDSEFYGQELFAEKELAGYLKQNLLPATRSVYEQVVYDSDTEKSFAEELEANLAIKVYAKLPDWFKIPTPLGSYNPDWAVLVQEDDGERLYFVVETKSGLFTDDLRDKESAKISCGKAHFRALAVSESPAVYKVARRLEDVVGS